MKRSFQTCSLEGIPEGSRYSSSYMHRDVVSHCIFAGEHLISASIDGHIKFWKRQVDPKVESLIEFVKDFKAHETPIIDICSSPNKSLVASLSLDGTLRIFDLELHDLLHTIILPSNPRAFSFIDNDSLIISQRKQNFGSLWYVSLRSDVVNEICTTHEAPINKIISSSSFIITVDTDGLIKYWSHPITVFTGEENETTSVKDITPKKNKFSNFLSNRALSISFSPSNDLFCLFSSDRCIYLFKTESGKLYRIYKEDTFANETIGKIEEDLSKSPYWECKNVIFDESGKYLLFASPSASIKVLDHLNNKVISTIANEEIPPLYPLNISLFKGLPKNWASIKGGGITTEMASSSSFKREDSSFLVFTSWKRGRFYVVGNDCSNLDGRDIKNETCGIEAVFDSDGDGNGDFDNRNDSKSELLSSVKTKATTDKYTKAIIRSSMGDISFKFLEKCPLAKENFCKLAQKKYYDGTLFHRVIENFMLQGGDPTGSGEGGESCWGGVFDDEIVTDGDDGGVSIKFNKPFLVAMANSGPNSNGSQFFITVAECPWLDDKHTIFGEVIGGQDVLLMISKTPTNGDDRPLKDVKVVEIDIE